MAARTLAGTRGSANANVIAGGDGWRVSDVLCTSGPGDRAFEEMHDGVSIAIVAAGSFQYRSASGRALMTPGSLLLGNAGHAFECGHPHASGDRCIAFHYHADLFARIASDAGEPEWRFRAPHLPPLRQTSRLVARACAALSGAELAWDELATELAACAITTVAGRVVANDSPIPRGAAGRVTRSIRRIDRQFASSLTLDELARDAGLSQFHFLRTFERVAGTTPHQYLLRTRLRHAAIRLANSDEIVLSVALACGFGDLSNFNRTFRAEFGITPSAFRRMQRRDCGPDQNDS